jgi:ubiquinone/menaquinone biosynthesis C-methylase UbiE
MQKETDSANEDFWDEPCGESHFKSLGFKSLSQFDDWFFNEKYPYLETIITFDSFNGKKVLEVGLGYGSVSEKIMQAGATFFGLDIAKGPVQLIKKRILEKGYSGEVIQGSVLECPWKDSTFDGVVSIGCLHHTGDLHKGIKELHRVLKPVGSCVIMVYNAFSYRQVLFSPAKTIQQFFLEKKREIIPRNGKDGERMLYDSNLQNESAPTTDFISSTGLKSMLSPLFSQIRIVKLNIGEDFIPPVFRKLPRKFKLNILDLCSVLICMPFSKNKLCG